MRFSLLDLADRFQLQLVGEAAIEVDRMEPLVSASAGALSFLSQKKFQPLLLKSAASAVILKPEWAESAPMAVLLSDNPYLSYAKIARLLHSVPIPAAGIHASATIDSKAQIDPTASIAAQVVIEAGVVVEAGCFVGAGSYLGERVHLADRVYLNPHVTIHHDCYLGKRVKVQSGTVIGAEGFGYANEEGRWLAIPQIGAVQIGDDVEIGANTTIDRGALEDTVIEEGVILDNLIQVAHNVHIGAFSAIAGCVGIAGSAKIGRHCTVGGAAGILGHLEIADYVNITAKSLVTSSIGEAGTYSSGTPLQPNRLWKRNRVRFSQLDLMARRLAALEKK
ncbi:MAG: UDP-3-O-(3-hydroxymyristoyl)glucosamine N-acyltransferase [Gammaproteobacteria bacterium]|nr:UDP-3-O-(3-hydroxymyristoyl)glucosamine N-acyltransferase [Gammaproteobacteria bacterium]